MFMIYNLGNQLVSEWRFLDDIYGTIFFLFYTSHITSLLFISQSQLLAPSLLSDLLKAPKLFNLFGYPIGSRELGTVHLFDLIFLNNLEPFQLFQKRGE